MIYWRWWLSWDNNKINIVIIIFNNHFTIGGLSPLSHAIEPYTDFPLPPSRGEHFFLLEHTAIPNPSNPSPMPSGQHILEHGRPSYPASLHNPQRLVMSCVVLSCLVLSCVVLCCLLWAGLVWVPFRCVELCCDLMWCVLLCCVVLCCAVLCCVIWVGLGSVVLCCVVLCCVVLLSRVVWKKQWFWLAGQERPV